ncbi:MAG: hypothetical protein VB140_05735 [Burkholderia sp.]
MRVNVNGSRSIYATTPLKIFEQTGDQYFALSFYSTLDRAPD